MSNIPDNLLKLPAKKHKLKDQQTQLLRAFEALHIEVGKLANSNHGLTERVLRVEREAFEYKKQISMLIRSVDELKELSGLSR